MRFIKKIFGILFVLVFVFGCMSSVNSNNFLWKIEKKENVNYILGSVHMMSEDSYPLNSSIIDAFNKSDFLVVEADITKTDNLMRAQKLTMENGYFKEKKLEDVLDKDLLNKLKNKISKYNIPFSKINQMKPWLASMTIEQLNIMQSGAKANLGIDSHFLTKAQEENMEIKELESIDLQMELLSSFTGETGVKFLKSSLKETEKKDKFKKMVELWKHGKREEFKNFIFEERAENPGLKDVYTKLLDERNIKMVEKIEGYFEDDKINFIVVGAGHLVGENGILNLLESKGYNIEQL